MHVRAPALLQRGGKRGSENCCMLGDLSGSGGRCWSQPSVTRVVGIRLCAHDWRLLRPPAARTIVCIGQRLNSWALAMAPCTDTDAEFSRKACS